MKAMSTYRNTAASDRLTAPSSSTFSGHAEAFLGCEAGANLMKPHRHRKCVATSLVGFDQLLFCLPFGVALKKT